jgi:signal transduction histidine kinase
MHARRNVYLLFKEAVHNMAKYSKCTAAQCTLQTDGKVLTMTVEDNGRGFDTENTPPGNGQKTMLGRAQALGGTLQLRSAPGKGTRIVFTAAIGHITG